MRVYLIVMLALAGLTALMAAPDLATLLTLLTLGLGLPLVFAGTGLAYGLCAAPLVASWPAGGRARGLGAAASAILVATVALAPEYVGRRAVDAAAAARLAADHAPAGAVRASTLEIRRPANSYDSAFADQKACGAECRSLLAGGQAQWVRVVEIRNFGAPAVASSTFHRALHGKDCAVPGGEPAENAICVIEAADPGDAAELVVEFKPPVAPGEAGRLSAFASVVSERAVTARTSEAGQASEAMRQTEVTVETPYRPTILAPAFQSMHSGGIDVMRRSYKINPLTLSGALTRLGYSLRSPDGVAPASGAVQPDWRAPLDADMTREMIAVLDLPGDAPFNGEQMATISTWVMHARNLQAWTPDLLALLRRFVRDRRVRAPTFFDQIFAGRPEVAKAVLPDVLDRIEAEGIGRDYTPARQAAYRFDSIDEELLKPYADRIVALLDKGRDVRAILLPAIGRIGVDPLPYLTPILADRTDPSQYSIDPRAMGACRADPQWAKELIGPLRDACRDAAGERGDDQHYREVLLKALTNLGDRDFVEHELASSSRIDSKRLRQAIDSDLARKKPADWLCRWL
jgi:hypothetical protein